MRGGMLRYFRPEGQFGRGILRTLLKPAEPELRAISSKASGNLGSVDLDRLGRKRKRKKKEVE